KQPKKSMDVIKKMQIVTQDKTKDINNFLDTEQFKIGKGVVLLKPGVELLPILSEIISVLNPGAQSKGIYLKLEKPEKIFTVIADREKLKSALFNIIDNSVKYTLKGGVDIKIENHNKVKIIVSDTGIGIPQDKIKNIFETQFERMEQAKETAIGSGVGLYLSSQIIKLHNGKIWVESKGQNQGSTFYIELPIS
ncbi:MAG: HAMP domain-containing sensor histidine kinase, partial [Candidatus Staskawiczbacteria bacterium]|nr:HAMP domain-containing sensor histidine kinase [Candidatus Staskawiczbacteria bacterium]